MKVTAKHPVPVPITWTLVLNDDEMAEIADALLRSPSATVYNRLYQEIGEVSLDRLKTRGAEVVGR